MTQGADTSSENPLPPLRICSFESRKGDEMKSLLERHSTVVTIAPSMREIPLDENPQAFAFAEQLFAGRIDVVVFMTGIGTRELAETLDLRYDRAQFLAALEKCTIVVRGPKPAAVLREWRVHIDYLVPEPNTWRELLQTLDNNVAVAGRTVAVQEYGEPNDRLYEGLAQRQARVVAVPVYRWGMPVEPGPLHAAIRGTIAGEFDVLMFTSAQQARNVLAAAESLGTRQQWLAAANRCVVASIGPTASETLRELGLPPDIEPEHPKMGHLVIATMHDARERLGAKLASTAGEVDARSDGSPDVGG